MFRRFFAVSIAILLCCAVLCGNVVLADVVHAYRKPSEADIRWLFDGDSPPVPGVSGIAQAGIVQTGTAQASMVQTGVTQVGLAIPAFPTSSSSPPSMLIPRRNLCDSVNVPIPMPSSQMPPGESYPVENDPIGNAPAGNSPAEMPSQTSSPSVPPTPQTAQNRVSSGLAPEIDGVVSIAPIVVGATSSVVQMAGERLPPPTEVPTEQSLTAPTETPAVDFTIAPTPLPSDHEQLWETFSWSSDRDLSCAPFNFGCGDFGDDFGCGRSGGSVGCGSVGCGNACNDSFTCVCITCLTCGDHRRNRARSCTPDMLGSHSWLHGHYVGTANFTFTQPTMLLTRPNAVERFNAQVRNRIWGEYRTWNNAVAIDRDGTVENRAVEQFSFGLEQKLLQSSSVEVRIPVIYQFGSNQFRSGQTADASAELGNVSVFLKQALGQNCRWTVSGGIGVSLPTARDWRSPVDTARLENRAYYLVSFLGVQWHPNNRTFGHFVVQTDLPIIKNELAFGGEREKVSGQQMLRTGFQLGRWIYRIDHGNRPCRLGLFTEINYAVVTNGSSERSLSNGIGETIYIGAVNSRKSSFTAALGVPMVFGQLTCTNALILPISGSNRPFSVGYSFSLTRQF